MHNLLKVIYNEFKVCLFIDKHLIVKTSIISIFYQKIYFFDSVISNSFSDEVLPFETIILHLETGK